MKSTLKNILSICDHISVADEYSFSICGQKVMAANYEAYTSWKGRIKDFGANRQPVFPPFQKLEERLKVFIYQYFYSTGSTDPDINLLYQYGTFTSHPLEQESFMNHLSEYNRSIDRYDMLWTVEKIDEYQILASKNGKYRDVQYSDIPQEFVSRGLNIGDKIHLINRKDDFYLQPYFYYVFGNERTNYAGELIRFYFNLDPSFMHLLIEMITSRFNHYEVPFSFKCLNHLDYYRCRADGAVLYMDKQYFRIGWRLLKDIYSELSSHFNENVPLFAYRISDGLGFAENPGKYESFGMSRCDVLTQMILNIHARDKEITEKCIKDYFLKHGIDLDRIHLNIDSGIEYSFNR